MTDLTQPAPAVTLPMPIDDCLAAVEARVVDWLPLSALIAVNESGNTPRMLATAVLVALYGADLIQPLLTYPSSKISAHDPDAHA